MPNPTLPSQANVKTGHTVAPADPGFTAFQVPGLPPTMVTSPVKRFLMHCLFKVVEAGKLITFFRHPAKICQAFKQLKAFRQQYFGRFTPRKMAFVAGRFYRGFHSPGWPAPSYQVFLTNTLNRLEPRQEYGKTLNMVILAITKKCPLACEHCFEWNALNKKEKLSLSDIKALVETFQARRVPQLFFSGGEPMLRVHDILAVLQTARPGTDFWVITSGFHFTLENARKLKEAGLTGISISLDHYEPGPHNAFRGSDKAYENAIRAACHAHQVGLVVNLAVCATREFTTAENLMNYARQARKLGVAFIQLLEPRAVGHFAAKPVELDPDQQMVLEDFYEKLNYAREYRDWPMVTYYGYHQRRLGCSGAGDRFLYVDTDGDIHACPFCQRKSGSALACTLDESIDAVRERGCLKFKKAPF